VRLPRICGLGSRGSRSISQYALLAEIVVELGVPGDPGPEGSGVIGMARAFLRQAVDLVEDPGRAPGWDRVDEVLLQETGRSSAPIAAAVRAAEEVLDGLGARLRARSAGSRCRDRDRVAGHRTGPRLLPKGVPMMGCSA